MAEQNESVFKTKNPKLITIGNQINKLKEELKGKPIAEVRSAILRVFAENGFSEEKLTKLSNSSTIQRYSVDGKYATTNLLERIDDIAKSISEGTLQNENDKTSEKKPRPFSVCWSKAERDNIRSMDKSSALLKVQDKLKAAIIAAHSSWTAEEIEEMLNKPINQIKVVGKGTINAGGKPAIIAMSEDMYNSIVYSDFEQQKEETEKNLGTNKPSVENAIDNMVAPTGETVTKKSDSEELDNFGPQM